MYKLNKMRYLNLTNNYVNFHAPTTPTNTRTYPLYTALAPSIIICVHVTFSIFTFITDMIIH